MLFFVFRSSLTPDERSTIGIHLDPHDACQFQGIRCDSTSVFFHLTPLSHGREVALWQILTMTTQTMSRRFGVEIEFLSTITREQAGTGDPDREMIDAWAEKLGIARWYSWQPAYPAEVC